MKYALIMIIAGYLPLQGPTFEGPPLAGLMPVYDMRGGPVPRGTAYSGPTISYVLKKDRKSCEVERRTLTQGAPRSYVIYAHCVPSPVGNLCHDFWHHINSLSSTGELPLYAAPDKGCIVQIGDGFGPTLGEAPLE